MTPKDEKAARRAEALGRRDALDAAARIEMSLQAGDHAERLMDFLPGTIVAGFLPIRSEIDLRPLMDRLALRGARLCVPAVVDRQTIVFRELVRGAALVDMGFGTRGPGPEAKALDPDIMMVPVAAFDATGHRIGYGAGHYDRAVARLAERGKTPRLIGFAFSVQEVDHVPAEPHDRRLQAVVTEKGSRLFDNKRSWV